MPIATRDENAMTDAVGRVPLMSNIPMAADRIEPALSCKNPNKEEALPIFVVKGSSESEAAFGNEIPAHDKITKRKAIVGTIANPVVIVPTKKMAAVTV